MTRKKLVVLQWLVERLARSAQWLVPAALEGDQEMGHQEPCPCSKCNVISVWMKVKITLDCLVLLLAFHAGV
jgi:hypothetical protein